MCYLDELKEIDLQKTIKLLKDSASESVQRNCIVKLNLMGFSYAHIKTIIEMTKKN